jgi:ankyrin repeat protein
VFSLTRKVYGSMNVSSGSPSWPLELSNNDIEETGTELAAVLTQGPGWLSSFTGTDDDSNSDLVAERRISNVGSHSALSSVSRTDNTSHLLLSVLYSVTNNLLRESQASKVFDVISRGINRKFFEALIANVSPTTNGIARMFLPAAIQCADALMVKSLLATGISPNFDMWLKSSYSLFVNAIRSGNAEIIQHFLDHGANAIVPTSDSQYTPLEAAARTGRTDVVRLLLQAGAGLNVAELNHGSSALCLAAKYGELELVQLLVDAGADASGSMRPYLMEGYRITRSPPLYHAAKRADVAMVKYLISCAADISVLGAAVSNGDMPMLHLLLSYGANNLLDAMICADHSRHKQVVRFLVGQEFDTHGTLGDAFGRAALQAAVRCNDIELLAWLLDFGISASVNPAVLRDALRTAAHRGRLSITQLLVARGADVNASLTILQNAICRRHRHIVEFLLRSGADINAPEDCYGRLSVATAIDEHQTEVVRLLVSSGADMNKHGPSAVIAAIRAASPELLRIILDAWTLTGDMDRAVFRCGHRPLCVAALCANAELTRILLDYKVPRTGDASYALPRAIECSNLEVVRLLLASGASVGHVQHEICCDSDPDARYCRLATALDRAAAGSNTEILDLLLKYPTTVEDRSRALQVAASHNRLEAVIVLLDHGANVNAAPLDSDGHAPRTALQAAAENGDLKLVRCLLDAGATVESVVPSSRERYTALQLAAIAGSIDIAVALIQRGADVNAPSIDTWRKTAMEGAAENGRLDMVQLLINAGAERADSLAVNVALDEGHDGVVALLLANDFEEIVWSESESTEDEAEA